MGGCRYKGCGVVLVRFRVLRSGFRVEANGVGAGNGAYELEWCVAALEAEGADIDKAVVWLKNWAPLKSETR